VNHYIPTYFLIQDRRDSGPIFGWALEYAVCGQHTEIVRLLLERGADPTLRYEDGLDALMLLGERSNKEAVEIRELLLEAATRHTSIISNDEEERA